MVNLSPNLFKLRPLILLAFVANFATIIFFTFTEDLPSAPTSKELIVKILWLPAMWLASIIIAIVVVYKRKKSVFVRPILKWTWLALILCTPIPLALINELTHPNASVPAEIRYIRSPGLVIRREKWIYNWGAEIAVIKYYKLNRDDDQGKLDILYKKDSTWIYYDRKGNILKKEKYRNGNLFSNN